MFTSSFASVKSERRGYTSLLDLSIVKSIFNPIRFSSLSSLFGQGQNFLRQSNNEWSSFKVDGLTNVGSVIFKNDKVKSSFTDLILRRKS